MPEPEINESEPTYYYYKVFLKIFLIFILEMGLVNFSMGLH